MKTLAKTKNIPTLRFPGFFGEWEEKKLGDVAKITTGQTPPTSNRSFYEGNFLFVSPADFYGQRYITETKTTCTKAGFDKVRKVGENSVLFVCIGSTIGKVAQAGEDCITNQQINSLTATANNSNDFIFYNLLNKADRVRLLAGKQAVPMINKSDFSKIKSLFPNFSEQQKIAEFLGAIDEWIENLRGQKEDFESYKKGMMQKIFSQEIKLRDDKGNKFPKWKEKKLGEIFSAEKGNGLPKDVVIVDGKNECILYGELYTKYKEVIFNISSKTNSNDGLRSEVGDLLIPCSTTTTGIDLANITALNKKGVLLGGDITVLRSKENIDNIFYAYYLSNYKKRKIASYAQGSTIVHLYYNHFKKMKIGIPAFKEQQKIAKFLVLIDNLIKYKQQQITQAEQWKKGLMQGLFV